MTGRRSLGHDLAAFGIASVAAQLVSAATTPLFTRILGPTQFGVLETAMAVISLALTVLVLGFDQGVVVLVSGTNDVSHRGSIIGTSIGLPTLLTTLCAIAGVAAACWSDERLVVVAAAISLPFLVASYVSQQGLRALDAVKPFIWSVALRSLAATAITCGLVLTISPNAAGVLIGTAIGAGCAVIANFWALRRRVPLRVTGVESAGLLRFGIPLLPSAVAGWSSMLVDRLVLASFVSFEEVGIYSVAARISGLLLTVLFGFQTAWTARAVTDFHHDADAEPKSRAEAMLLLGGLVGLSGATLCAFGPELVAVLGGPQYESATSVLPILVPASAFYALTAVAQIPALATGRTGTISAIALISAAANLVLNLLLIPTLGMKGAAIATLAAFMIMSGLQLGLSRSIRPAALPLGRIGLIWLAMTPVACTGLLAPSPLLTVAKVVIVGLAAAGLHHLRLFTYGEAKRILVG